LDYLSDPDKNFVPFKVSICVVEIFKIVNVHKEEREWVTIPIGYDRSVFMVECLPVISEPTTSLAIIPLSFSSALFQYIIL
jgi:hypothetical protein